jgi:parallel beta-helix repeat protein
MIIPQDSLYITQDTIIRPGVYYIPNGIMIVEDGITLNGNGAVFIGKDRNGHGISIQGRRGVTIKNLKLRDYYHGIYACDCRDLMISNCQVTSTAEIQANTIFLDIWRPHDNAYGGGILLVNTRDSQIINNDFQHQMIGMLSYDCQQLTVQGNNASYCSGWGFHTNNTSSCLYENNFADFCCRWEPRSGRNGHMGADAAGFLILHNSCKNIFRRNNARVGGDGFFLAGLRPDYEPVPCNDNLFEENDGSWSPNIAFEATFSAGNIYRNNYADHCNYGFWLGFSRDGILENNRITKNTRAGIAVENGFNFQVKNNLLQDNEHGLLLWSKYIPDFLIPVPLNETSYNWQIEGNSFLHNNKAIRIEANQDHGIRPYTVPEGQDPTKWYRPHDHVINHNSFKNNRIGVEAIHTDRTFLTENIFEDNIFDEVIKT